MALISGLIGFRELQSLHIPSDYYVTAEEENQLQQNLDEIDSNSPKLRQLSIYCPKLSFVKAFTQLIELNIYSLESITSFAHLSQFKQLKRLRIINTEDLSANSFLDIGQHLPQLESLIVEKSAYSYYSGKFRISDQMILNISELKKLKSFELIGYSDDSRKRINSSTIRRLFDNTPDMRRLVLRRTLSTCPKSQRIALTAISGEIIRETIDLFKSRAERNPKIDYYFETNQNDFNERLIDSSNNLRINLLN